MLKTITVALIATLGLVACADKPAEEAAPVTTEAPAAEAPPAPTDVAVDAAPAVDAGAAPVEAIKPPVSDK